jgi:hypothetical protein
MNKSALLLFAVPLTASGPAFAESSNCPLDLPFELYRDCRTAEFAAESDENGLAYFGETPYDMTANLQAWVDRQMKAEFDRESDVAPEGSDVARQADEP